MNHIPDIDNLAAYALVEHDGSIIAREYTGAQFRRLVEAGKVDLRRAK